MLGADNPEAIALWTNVENLDMIALWADTGVASWESGGDFGGFEDPTRALKILRPYGSRKIKLKWGRHILSMLHAPAW